jgi:hypothetical protein
MTNPFPGMNPYLEQFWGYVHHSLITYACDRLQFSLPRDLRARVEERVFVESPGDPRSFFPDVRIVQRSRRKSGAAKNNGGVALAEPIRISLPNDPISEGFIEILDLATGRRVVTVIEILSPYNKVAGRGRKLYLQKQEECCKGGVNLVEIDLLRTGKWTVAVPQDLVEASHRSSYKICILRAGAGHWDFYPAPLRERLPVIPIPLRKSDADVPLDLQALLDQCYRNGAYDEDIDYKREPIPPLAKEDRHWADELLRKKRRRSRARDEIQTPAKRLRKPRG